MKPVRRRVLPALLAALLLAISASPVAAAPPVAVDDPGVACGNVGFGGAFPIPEDFTGGEPGFETWFVLTGSCSLIANDSDPDSDPLDWEVVDDPANGEVVYLDPDLFAYRPDPDFSTLAGDLPGGAWISDTFTYHALGGGEASNTATMRFWIAAVNDAPSFTPGGDVTVAEDSGAFSAAWATGISPGPSNESDQTVAFEISDIDITGDPALFSTDPAIDAGGTLTFEPGPGKSGVAQVTVRLADDGGLEDYGLAPGTMVAPDDTSDEITFAITVEPDAGPGDPVAGDDDRNVSEDQDPVGLFSVLVNDDDPNDDPLTIVDVSDPDLGTATIESNDIHYVPDPDAFGIDTFTYTISDGNGGTDVGTVTVAIAASNDPPSFTGGGDVTWTEDDGHATFTAWATDISAGPPNESAQVADLSFTIESITDSTLFQSTPTFSADGDLEFDPAVDAFGSTDIEVSLFDGGGTENNGDQTSDPVTFTVTIEPAPDDPVAGDDVATVGEDATATAIPVLANDDDVDGDTLLITAKTNGAKGTVAITGGGTGLTYDPATDATGADSFTYTISDGTGRTDTATVSVTISADDDPPVVNGDTITILEDAATTTIDVLANDTDVEGDPLTVTGTSDPAQGTAAVIDAGAQVTYRPDANVHGFDTFDYTVEDGLGHTTGATVTVNITPVNDAPTADADALTVAEDAAATAVPVLVGDADVDLDTLLITAKTNGAKGTVAITGGGTGLTYKPGANLSGADSFTYTIDDGHGGTATGTVTVTISAAQDVPNAVNDPATVPEGAGATTIPVLANDSDPDGDTLAITSVTNGSKGTVAITGGGTGLTYDPAALKDGADTFTYTVSDGHGGTDSATVLVTITPDTAPPTLGARTTSLPGQTIGSSTVKVNLAWSGTDPGSGIASYRLQVSVNGGSYTTIALPTATATTIQRTLTVGATYRFRVRATDREGNVSAYASWTAFTPTRYQESSGRITYTGSWSTSTNAKMSGGKGRHTSSSTRRARIAFTGTDIGWVATRLTSSGRARVYIDGALIGTIDLDASATQYRKMVFRRHLASAGSHTLEIRPIGDGRVDVDAFIVLR